MTAEVGVEDVVHRLFVRMGIQYTRLTSPTNGIEMQIRCPFHKGGQERKPSFSFNVNKRVYHCYACNASGGLRQLMRAFGLSREEVDQQLQEVEWRTLKTDEPKRYGDDLLTPNQVLPEHLLGMFDYTPKRLTKKGFPAELLQQNDIGYDLVNQRVTYPIRDVYGQLIGISGRSDSPYVEPRYKFYDDNELGELVGFGYRLEKGVTFWNAHAVLSKYLVSQEVEASEPCIILVEGFNAALRLLQYGVYNVVASMGAAITPAQRYILSLVGLPVVLFYDNNEAGLRGTWRAYQALQESTVPRVSVVQYPEGTDGAQPDDLTKQQIEEMVEHALQSIPHFAGDTMSKAQNVFDRTRRTVEQKTDSLYSSSQNKNRVFFWKNEFRISPGPGGARGPTAAVRLLAGEYHVPPHVATDYPKLFSPTDVLPFYPHVKYFLRTRGPKGNSFVYDTRDWEEGRDLCLHLKQQDSTEDINGGLNFLFPAVDLGSWHFVEKKVKGRTKEFTSEEWVPCLRRECPHCEDGVEKTRGRAGYIELSSNFYKDLGAISTEIAGYCRCGHDKPLRCVAFSCSSCGHEFDRLDPEDSYKATLTVRDRDGVYQQHIRCPKCRLVLDEEGGDGKTTVKEVLDCLNDDCWLPEAQRASIYDADIALCAEGAQSKKRLVLDRSLFDNRGFRILPLERVQSAEALTMYHRGVLWDFFAELRTNVSEVGKKILGAGEPNPFVEDTSDGYEDRGDE